MTDTQAKTSDLKVRVISAIVMMAVAGGAFWFGGKVLATFIAVIALGLLYEWSQLSFRMWGSWMGKGVWIAFGLVYIGVAVLGNLPVILMGGKGASFLILPIAGVIATDIGAYFCGRAIGGPKIAPKISPNKTWAGLAGGMLAAATIVPMIGLEAWQSDFGTKPGFGSALIGWAIGGAILAVVAQAGDFLESWMKRKAGVKDSGRLIPGHGGLLDRLDGVIAVLFVVGLPTAIVAAVFWYSWITTGEIPFPAQS